MKYNYKYPFWREYGPHLNYAVIAFIYISLISNVIKFGLDIGAILAFFMFTAYFIIVFLGQIRSKKFAKEIMVNDELIKSINRAGACVIMKWADIDKVEVKASSYSYDVTIHNRFTDDKIVFDSAINNYEHLMNQISEHVD